jgi:glycerol-3-phosphate dehydrogenase (NAD(P)+)
LARVLESIGQVAEGVPTSEAAVMLAKRHHVETPIFEAVHGVLREHLRPLEAVDRLMERMPKHESFAMECPS